MSKKQIISLLDLEQALRVDIANAQKPVAVIGGHYPIDQEGKPQTDSFDVFGIFPYFTMDMAARLVKYGKEHGKDVKLALLVDDHSQMNDRWWYMRKHVKEVNEDTLRNAEQTREIVENYFRTFSLPFDIQGVLNEYDLTLDDFVHSKYGLPFQESRYREEFAQQTGLDPGCSGEYKLILEELAGKGFSKVIAFLPLRCFAPTCTAKDCYNANRSNPTLKTVHVYIPTDSDINFPTDLAMKIKEMGGVNVIREG